MWCPAVLMYQTGPLDMLLCGADPDYSKELIRHARKMLEFGLEHPGSYMLSKQDGLRDHGKHYPSSNYNDEMAWGALWLYKATGVRTALSLLPASPSCIALLDLQQYHGLHCTILQCEHAFTDVSATSCLVCMRSLPCANAAEINGDVS